MVEVMNAVGIDYVTYGNHEFDIKEAENIARGNESKFKIISTNVAHRTPAGSEPFQQNGVPVPAHVIHTFKLPDSSDFQLGLFGVTLDANQAKYVQYANPYASADLKVNAMRQKPETTPDLIFGLSHLTMDMDDSLGRTLDNVPLIFGGHEHVNMVRKAGQSTIYKADANAKTVWIHWCRFNKITRTLETDHLLYPITEALPDDPNVQMVVRRWESFADDCMRSQGYKPDDTIGFYLNPLDGREDAIRFGPTNLGMLIADGMRAVDPSVQVAVLNSGSIRLDDVLQGFVTQRDILATLPFGGKIQRGDVLGKDLRRLLDTGLAASIRGNGAYLQTSGVTMAGNQYLIGGQALDDAQTYAVVMPKFLADGGENAMRFVADFCTYTDPALPGGIKNDLRDITIAHMKRNGNMALARQLLARQR
jgi:2',3'-cyclic-nucleotide 2'-phosphodiesterase (5'-nucleotidase family)